MNIKFKRLMSLLMCCIMLFGMIPVDAFATGATASGSIVAEEKTVDDTAVVPSADEAALPDIPSANAVIEEPVADEPVVPQPEAQQLPAEEPVQKLYEELMAFETYEALRIYMDNMTAEQLEVMNQFTYDQTKALNDHMNALQGDSGAPVSDEPAVEEEAAEEEITEEVTPSEQPALTETETTEGTSKETTEAATEETTEGATEETTEGATEETTQEDVIVSEETQTEEEVTSSDAADGRVSPEEQINDADALFNRLMAAATYEELDAMMEAMTEEEHALMDQFSDEQNAALDARVDELNSNDVIQLDAVTLRQGETATYTQSVERNDYDFRIEKDGAYVSSSASGITVTNDGNYTIKVVTSENTPVGDYTIHFGTYGFWGRFHEAGTISLTVTEKIEADTPVVDQKTMTFDKTVTANANGNYDLKLTLSGAVGSKTDPAKVDVVLVIDKSGSMNSGNRLSDAKSAARTLIDALDGNDNIDARYNVISFNGTNTIRNGYSMENSTDTSGWLTSATSAKNSVNSIVAERATNYEAALLRTQQQLGSARAGATTIVVFLTDGNPTLRCSNYVRNDGIYGYGTGDDSDAGTVQRCLNAAVAAVGNIAMNRFYVVGTGNVDEENLNALKNGATLANYKTVKMASDDNLSDVFSDIAAEVSTFLCENVTITDTLNHVDGTTALDRMVEVTNAESVKVTVYKGDAVIAGPAASVNLRATDMNAEAELVASYNAVTGVLKLDFPDTYQLEPDYTYVLSAEIAPTERAYEEYRNSGYTESGDSNTGTHSGQFGFYSNDSAIVTYTYQGAASQEKYDHPVVQLHPGSLVINKKVVGMDVAKLSQLTFDVAITYPGKEETVQSIPFTQFTDTDGDGTYTYPLNGLSPNTEYTVTEKGYEVQDYEVDAKVTGGDSTSGLTASGTVEKGATDTVNFTNTYTLAKISISGTKVWVDNENQDGIRPASITVNLLENGTQIASKEVTAEDNWEWTFEDVAKFDAAGKEITYTVTENAVEGYTATIEGYTITNTHTPSVIDIAGTKTWSDANNQDGIRPKSITINLLKKGTAIETVTVSEETGWAWSFENLPEYEAGKKIEYAIAENPVEGYDTTYNGYNVTNTHTPAKISIPVTKEWLDANNQDGKRPASVTIRLLADKADTGMSLTLNKADGWKGNFENLDKYKDGKEIVYTVKEELKGDDYTAKITGSVEKGYTITNTHTPETIDIAGRKIWEDNDNQDGKRPGSITVHLWADDIEVDSKTVYAADGWAWTFAGMPKYKAGKEIKYTITEDAVAGYDQKIVGHDVINTHAPETIDIEGTKSWKDANNQDGIRPSSITVNLLADDVEVDSTTASVDTNWEWSFKGLAKYEAGKEITYTVTEEYVENYTSELTGDVENGYIVTNTHIPETIDIAGTKKWDDNENQDGKRPESITVRLMANGKEVGRKTVTEADGWAWTFTDVPKFAAGTDITYTVSENPILDAEGNEVGYNASYDGYNITNKYDPEKTNVTVTKKWDDANNQDGMRPDSIKVTLLADGKNVGLLGKSLTLSEENGWKGTFENLDKYKAGVEIVYTVTEEEVKDYTADIDGFTITNTHTPETIDIEGTKTWDDNDNQDGIRPVSITVNLMANGEKADSIKVTAEDNWTWSFRGVPKYAGGKEIVYTVTEDDVDGYEATINGFDITNTHTPATIAIEGTKTWVDNENQDGKRPASITVNLLADGTEVKEAIVTATANWEWKFTDLPKYRDGGKEIVYTVTEDKVTGYEAAINGFDITNTHEIEKTSISGTKIWEDNNNQDGKRPKSITINLTVNNEKVDSQVVVTPDENGLWTWTFDNLDKYKDGVEITYGFQEEMVDGYTTTYNGNEIINKHTPDKTSVQVSKIWNDNNNQDGKRPNGVTIILVADNAETEQELDLNESNGWKGTFENLDKYKDGKEIVYTVTEKTIEGGAYTAAITGSAEEGYVVTNTHKIEKISISGTKTWDDKNNQDGKRPAYICVNLLADGEEVAEQRVEKNEKGWTYTFADLDKYKDGVEIRYSVTEDALKDAEGNDLGYTATYSDKNYDITNTYEPEKTSINVIKVWEDANDQDGKRPGRIKVMLLADGEDTKKSITLSEKKEWKGSFENLDKYKDGKLITYTVAEEAVDGYKAVISGDAPNLVITNVHEPETIEKLSGTKTWDDDSNRDGKRPESITVRLLANGKEVANTTVTAKDNWVYEFNNLPKYEAGKEIVYTVTEDAVEGYSVEYSKTSLNITNQYTPGKTSLTVTKRWIDGHDNDGIRPSSVTIYLYANGVKIDKMKLTAKGNWTGVFDNLFVYENGEPIKYTIQEKSVSGYNTTITGSAAKGFTVTNTHNIIPKTGDESNLPLYTGLFGASFSAMAVLLFLAKPKKKGKYLR